MSLIVSQGSGKEFSIHPVGPATARCTRIIDMGTVDGEFEGKAKKDHKIAFCWESSVLMGDDEGEFAGKPYLVTQRWTASLSDKANMRKALEAWRGRPFTPVELDSFDLKNVLSKACILNMVHSDPSKSKGKTYANIASIMPLMAGMTAPKAVGELIFFSMSDFNQATYDSLSDYYRGEIAKCDEYKALFGGKPTPATGKPSAPLDEFEDDIPF